MSKSEFGASHSIITNAAELLLKCAGFLDDRAQATKKDDGPTDTYFAVDTDVICLYIQPDRMTNYLDVFEGDPPSTRELLTILLGDFLFKTKLPLIPEHRQTCRFLIVPPHDEELLTILSAIHRDLAETAECLDSQRFETLSAVLENYQRDRDDKTLLASLTAHASDLAALYSPYASPKAALTRYARLTEGTFQRLDTYREHGFAFPTLDPINRPEDRQIADPLIDRWEGLLWKHRRHEAQQDRADLAARTRTDAEVLATIEFVNSQLRKERKQLVLVTGSNYLFRAADEVGPPEGGGLTFADMYLRHPQSFLAHPSFFKRSNPSEDVQFNLIDWLNLLLPSSLFPVIHHEGMVDRGLLRGIRMGKNAGIDQVVRFLTRRNDRAHPISHLLGEWRNQVDAVAKDRYAEGLDRAADRGLHKLAEKLTRLRAQNRWSLDELRRLVFEESLQSISQLYSKTVWVGLWSKAVREQSKGVPALRFDDKYKSIEPYLEKVISLQLQKEITGADLAELLDLNAQLEAADDSLYHAHVIHALAFAVKGHNYATLTLAKTAMSICDHLKPEQRGYRLGREAAYLAAIAVRRSAMSRGALDKAERFLRQAIKRENPAAESESEDIRFVSERLAIETRHIYFGRFCERTSDAEKTSSVLTRLNQLIGEAHSEKDDRVRHWVLRQSLTNYLMLVLVLKGLKEIAVLPAEEEIRKNQEALAKTLVDPQYGRRMEDDPYAYLVSLVHRAQWESNTVAREKMQKTARDICGRLKKPKADRAPYERGRLELLESLVSCDG